MGLLSRPANVDPDTNVNNSSKAAESRWLFPLKRFEEEILEHILISASCSAPWAGRRGRDLGQQALVDGTISKERPMKDLVQRKFEKLGKNVAGKVKTLKHAFSETTPEKEALGTGREECRKVACNEIVRATLSRHPGSQLPDVFVSTLQAHFDALPSSYAKAGFNSEQVFMHIRLLEEAKSRTPNVLAVHLQAADCMSRSGNVSEFSSTSSSPISSVWDETERGLPDEVVDVAFACNTAVSKAALVWVFEHEMVSVKQATVFERKGVSLGVLTIQSAREKTQQEFVRRVIKSAIRKSRFSKFSLGLCGCEVPSFADQKQGRTVVARKEPPNVSNVDERNDFKENYWNEADFNFTSTSFVNSGYEYGTYGYPCYAGGPSTPGGLFRILVAEGVSPEIISGEEELGRWVLDSAELHVEEEIASSGTAGSVFRGTYKGETVAVKEITGVKGGSVLEGELRRDVLAIASSKHKNLVPFYGISVDSRHSSYIATVSKYMAGGSLRSLIQRSSSIPLSELLRIAKDVAEGLRFLHDNGIVHRNLRSSRILMDGNGVARVGDLGLARLWNGFLEGTPHTANYQWMAPEALGADSDSSTITGRSDVYSFGMLLWEMLTGQIPFDNFSPVQAAVGVAVHGLRPTIPEDTFQPLKTLMEQCWSRDPLDRPDFSEILDVLDNSTQELLSRDKS
ncbi:unnamed protein product [Calypogeia fissa]